MLDFFFHPQIPKISEIISIANEDAKHIKVLRKQNQDKLILVNGSGFCSKAQIIEISAKEIRLKIIDQSKLDNPHKNILAIAQIKDRERLEWVAEKAVEIGIHALIILQTQHCAPGALRPDRLRKIMLAAMLQSKQAHLPELYYNYSLQQLFSQYANMPKYIAHCNPNFPRQALTNDASGLFIIGPEGDFSPAELEFSLKHAKPIILSNQRLRTETAAIVALCNATKIKNLS